ncbi:MAG: hypothetical protein J0I76_10025 [Thiobacillus sp.]|nr:hypothetical protein [Thiobacillus sp.]
MPDFHASPVLFRKIANHGADSIEVDDREVLDVLAKLAQRGGDLSPALKEIGEDMLIKEARVELLLNVLRPHWF